MRIFAFGMKKLILLILLIFNIFISYSQYERYSPRWFGPNALPVPETGNASISNYTTVDITGDYYFGFGDITKNGYLRIEIPLLAEKVSLKVWTAFLEHYRLTPELGEIRGIEAGKLKGTANSDIYVQTKIRLNKENKIFPSLILNTTLKTSSGTENLAKRYYNTSAYYFDIEVGKSYNRELSYLEEVRLTGNLGFLCWETDNYTQNDAPMYGAKIQLKKNRLEWEGGLRGYYGWMTGHPSYDENYGDRPLVVLTGLGLQTEKIKYYIQYQYGIKDFPYHQLRVGIQFQSRKLTPYYK